MDENNTNTFTNNLQGSELNEIIFDFSDLTKKSKNGYTFFEFCYHNKHNDILKIINEKKLKHMYKNKKFLDYCKKGNFAGVFTCIMNNIDIE